MKKHTAVAIVTNPDPEDSRRVREQLVADLRAHAVGFVEVCGRLAAEIDREPRTITLMLEEHPGLFDRIVLRRWENIGRRKSLPELAYREGLGWSKVRGMPLDVQRRLLEDPHVEMVIEKEAGGIDVMRIEVSALMPDEAALVFNGNDIRPPEAQRLELVRMRKQTSAKTRTATAGALSKVNEYVFVNRGAAVEFREGATFDKNGLLHLAQLLKG